MAAAQAPAAKQMLVDPQSPAFDTTHDAARALGDRFGQVGGAEQAAAIIKGTDGKYRYTTAIPGTHDHFEMHVGLHQGETMAAFMHSHPGMDQDGRVFSPNDLDVANNLKVPSYVKFAADNGAIRVFTPGATKTRNYQPSGSRFNVKVSDGDELPAAAPSANAGPAGPASIPVSGMTMTDAPARPAYWDAPIGGTPDAPAPKATAPATPAVHEPGASATNDIPAGPRPGYWDASMQPAPEPEAAPPAKPAESTFGSDVLTGIGARGAQVYSAAKEAKANHDFSSAREEYWRLLLQGDIVRNANKAGISYTDDPMAQEGAKHLGMRPDQFMRGWPDRVNMPEDQRQQRLGELQQQMVEATGNIAESSHARQLAGQVGREALPREHQFAYQALTMAPEIGAGLTLSMIPGGQAPAAALFASDFGLQAYANGRDSGLSDDQAKIYGSLSGLAAVVPQVPVINALGKTPAAQALMQTALGKVLSQSATGRVAGAVASQAGNEALALGVQNTLQAAIDKNTITPDMTLSDALHSIGEGVLMGATFGSFSGAMHAGINRAVNGPYAATHGASAQDALQSRIIEAKTTAMDHAQSDAFESTPGDLLDKTVAATTANAHVGAAHDAAAVEGARQTAAEVENQRELEFQQARAQQEAQQGVPPSEEAGFAAKEQAEAPQAAQDEAQKNQFMAGNPEEGTLAAALPPDQLNALAALRARMAAGKPAEAAPAAETTEGALAERRNAAAQAEQETAAGTAKVAEASAKPGGAPLPETPETLGDRRAAAAAAEQETPFQPRTKGDVKAEARAAKEAAATKADTDFEPLQPVADKEPVVADNVADKAPKGEEALPEGAPPAPTPKTLAERRQAELDAKMAAKVRGQPETITSAPEQLPEAELDRRYAALSDEPKPTVLVNDQPVEVPPPREGTPAAEGKPTNRLAARRALAAKTEAEAEAAAAPTASAEEAPAPATAEASIAAPAKAPEAAAQTRMAAIRAAAEKRRSNLPESAQSLIDELRAGRGKPTGKFAASPEQRMAQDMDRALHPRMTHDEATAHVQPVLDAMPPNLRSRTFVHGDERTALALPDNQLSARNKQGLRDYVEARGSPPAGMFDPDTNTVHIFGEGHLSKTDDINNRPGGKDELLKTAAHEMTHLGLRNVLGPKYGAMMEDIFSNAQRKQWMQDFLKSHNLDARDAEHRQTAADEYVAHLSENTDADPGVWRSFADGFRRLLRTAGLVREWNDNDLRDLVRRNNPMLDKLDPAARAGMAYKGGAARFSPDRLGDREMDEKLDPTDPKAIQYKLARTVEEQMDVNRGSVESRSNWERFVESAKGKGSDLAEWARDAAGNKRLAWIGLRNLPDFMTKDRMPALHSFIDDHDAMDGMRGRLVNEGADLARTWSKWQAKQPDRGWALSELMHASTLLGHDASRPFKSEYSKADLESPDKAQDDRYQKALHRKLSEDYGKLDSEGRALYQNVRDSYATSRQRIFDSLTKRIQETGADEQTKKNLMAELRQRFEAGKVKGVYFPLQRFGDRWGRAINPETGEHVSFSRFDNKDEQDQWLAAMREKGLQVDKGQRIDSRSEMERIDPDFVKKVMTLAHDADPKGELEKEIWQTYLKAMPEMSMRKHFIMRQGRLGFTQDALRAFMYNSFHGAHQQARLEYGNRLDTHLQNAKDQAEALATKSAANPGDKQADKDSEWGAALAKELENRLDWIKNPRSSTLASNLTKFGFMWYLGAAPATAFRISTQNMMLAQPQLARHFGNIGASKELMRAVGQWAGARGKLSDKLRGDERAAFERAADMGMFSNTNTQMLASGGEGAPVTGAYDKFQRISGYLFNAMEHKNRMTTFLAGYRLARAKGMSEGDAFNLARNVTWDSHFDYNNANRPGVLQNDFAKVAGLFRQYAWGVTYRTTRDFRDGFMANPQRSPEERAAARMAFSSTMARMMMFAGVTGLGVGAPVYSLISGLYNSVMNLHDPNTPHDMTAELHKSLENHMGKFAADSIMTGPIGAASGLHLSSGASYNDMWYKPPDREMKTRDMAMDALGQAAGPIAAIPMNAATGADLALQGHLERGLEHFLPPEAAALAKSMRYGTQGVKNLKGDTVVDKKDLSPWDLGVQGAGFTPEKVATQYAKNTASQNYIDQVQARKNSLSTNLRAAIVAGDEKEEAAVLKEVGKFNDAHRADGIGYGAIKQIRSEAKAAALSINGVRAPKGLREEVKEKF